MIRQDGQMRALYRLVTMPILAALRNATIAPPEQPEPDDHPQDQPEPGTPPHKAASPEDTSAVEEVKFTHNLFFLPASAGGMTHSFSQFIRRMLLAAVQGFSGFEMVYWVPKTGPMKNKVTLRKIDWRPSETLTFLLDGQGEFNGFRQRCVTADTQIATLSGESVRIDEMVRRHAAGQEQWVYSCTKDGRIVPGKVKHAWKNLDSAPIVEVELDNGEKVRCTPDHPWMLRDGTYRWASKLEPGDSLMPLYRKDGPVGASRQDYEYVQHPATGAWETTHRMVSDALGFGARGSEVIHHGFDGLKHRNNDPSNLHRMTRGEHCELHARLGQLHRSSISFADIEEAARDLRGKTGDRPTRAAVAVALGCSEHVIRDRCREAGIATWTEVCRGIEGHELTFRYVDDVARAMVAAGEKLTLYDLAAKLSWSAGSVFREIQAAGYAGWMEYRRILEGQPVITMEVIEATVRALLATGTRPDRKLVEQSLSCSYRVLWSRLKEAGFSSWESYLFTAFGVRDRGIGRPDITFDRIDAVSRAIAGAGLSLSITNVCDRLACSSPVIYSRLFDAGYSCWSEYRRSVTRNHKVCVVRVMPNEAVYDLEVEKYHNFALSAGVVVSNTFFEGRTIDVKIPKDRAFYFANGEEERPFYGVSLFESAFYHYDKKTKLYYIVHLAAQRAAVGTRIGTMPPNPAKQDKINFVNALRDLGMTQYIVVPSQDWTVTSLDETAGGRFDYLGLINHHNSQASKSLLAAWFDDDQGKGSSESTLVDFGTQNDETFMMMEQAIMDDMARCVNEHIIPRFIDWNFGTAKYPQFRFGTLTEEQQAALQDTFDKLATAPPGTISPEFVMALEKRMAKILGLNIDYGPIERRAVQAAAMQQKLARTQAEAQLTAPGPPGAGAQPAQPPAAAGENAGGSAGASAQPPRPPVSGGGSPRPKPPAALAARDQALVALTGEILESIMAGRSTDPWEDVEDVT